MFIDVHTTMLKASQNINVLSCRLKADWDDALRWTDSVPRGRTGVRETSLSKLGTQPRENTVGCFS